LASELHWHCRRGSLVVARFLSARSRCVAAYGKIPEPAESRCPESVSGALGRVPIDCDQFPLAAESVEAVSGCAAPGGGCGVEAK